MSQQCPDARLTDVLNFFWTRSIFFYREARPVLYVLGSSARGHCEDARRRHMNSSPEAPSTPLENVRLTCGTRASGAMLAVCKFAKPILDLLLVRWESADFGGRIPLRELTKLSLLPKGVNG